MDAVPLEFRNMWLCSRKTSPYLTTPGLAQLLPSGVLEYEIREKVSILNNSLVGAILFKSLSTVGTDDQGEYKTYLEDEPHLL